MNTGPHNAHQHINCRLDGEPRSMHDLTGWDPVTCRVADLICRGGEGLTVASSLTDPDGSYGSPVVFTEWWWATDAGEVPVLRDYRVPGVACTHYVGGPDAARPVFP